MFIFRVEHKREKCIGDHYSVGGHSPTGHGTYRVCDSTIPYEERPNFGLSGMPPRTVMMTHERCAVTAQQFPKWISYSWDLTSRNTNWSWDESDQDECWNCAVQIPSELQMNNDWHIVSYWIDETKEGIDWRDDNNQIVFNPEFAELIGSVELWEVEQFMAVPV
jgi:hypothetical protein